MIDRDREQRVAAFEDWLHSDKNPGGTDRLILDIAFTAGWRAAKVKKMPTITAPKLPFAVIAKGASKYGPARTKPPSQWAIFPIGRESDTRLYSQPAKPSNRWGSDPYKTKDFELLARFDTEAEAQAFIDAGKAAMAEPMAALKAAEEAEAAATSVTRDARAALHAAVTKFWAART